MALSAGMRLGAYEVISLLGAGGMGEVYQARDSRLKRDVALKVLPAAFSQDADRLGRFQREAELLASLNHPNIAAIYGLEKTESGTAIVLELVDGETLAEVIGRGPLPIADALPIARAIADALEAAHEKGIVHRDLKPANIKITGEGKVKVLDFGLAKVVDPTMGSGSLTPNQLTASPTFSHHATYAGVILGTAAYMSPEQVRGKAVDRRTDIWAFGCVLYEMLTGRRLFDAGDTLSDAIAAILKQDPDWKALSSDVPSHIRTLLKRCLQRDPQKRLPHIGIARLEIDEGPSDPALQDASARLPRRRSQLPPLAFTAALVALVAGGLTWWLTRSTTPQPVTRFVYTLPQGQTFGGGGSFLRVLAISPDGTQVVYAANQRLYLRSLADFTTRPISGTEIDEAGNIGSPVFSPDGESIAYWIRLGPADAGTLKRITLKGGAAITLAEKIRLPWGMSWSDEEILVGQAERGIVRVSATGGTPEQLISPDSDEWMLGPQLLPGGEAVLFTLAMPPAGAMLDDGVLSTARVVVQSLKSGERKTLVEGATDGRYLPTGHLVYAIGGVLVARAFDVQRQTVAAAVIPVIEGVAISRIGQQVTGSIQMSVSSTGSLIYVPGSVTGVTHQERDLVMVDRGGTIVPLKLPPAPYHHPRVSPDGKQITYYTDDGRNSIVWTYDLSGAMAPRHLTFEGQNRFPVWSHDGRRVTYQSVRDDKAAIYWQPADGAGPAEVLTEPEAGMYPIPNSWTPDGKSLFFENGKAAPNAGNLVIGFDRTLWTLSVADKKVVPFSGVQSVTRISPISAAVSRDGHWLVYTVGAESTRADLQIFVQQLPSGVRQLIAVGAADPQWHPNGKELFFLNLLGKGALSATITTQPQFAVGNPAPLSTGLADVFRRSRTGASSSRNVDIMPGGQHFIAAVDRELSEGTPAQINVVLNWLEELKARVPANQR